MNTRGELHSIPRLLAIIAGLVVLSGPSPAAERTVSVKFKTGAISSTISFPSALSQGEPPLVEDRLAGDALAGEAW